VEFHVPASQEGVRVNKFATFLGVTIGFALACSRTLPENDPDYQERIDEFCDLGCEMSTNCGIVDAYDACFEECSNGEYWWEGDDDCRDSRWEYYDCRAKVTTCDVWGVGYGNGHECDPAFERLGGDCLPLANRD
jgi:hypothetical protein